MAPQGAHSYQFGPFLLVAAERVLLRQGQRVPLTPKLFETLLTLVENAGHVVSKEILISRVWPDTFVKEDSLTFNISAIRKVLASHGSGNVAPTGTCPDRVGRSAPAGLKPGATSEAPNGQEFIHTEHKLGYRFVAPVTILPPASTEPEAGQQVSGAAHDGQQVSGVRYQVSGGGRSLPDGREAVRGEGFSVRHWVKLATAGLALLIVLLAAVWLATPPPEPNVLKYAQLTTDGREKDWRMATDGERVYFNELTSTGGVLAQVSASGGEPVPIASVPRGSEITDLSPDHRDLLVVEDTRFGPGTLELVPVLGGEPRRLGNIRAYSAAWSPDGTTLAYTTDGGVDLCDPDGSNSRRIVTLSGQMHNVHWSPSGKKFCFTQVERSGETLWEVDRDGGGLSRLFPGMPYVHWGGYGLWTPNGKYLITPSLCGGYSVPSAARLISSPFGGHWGKPACLEAGPLDLQVSAISPDSTRLFGIAETASEPQMEEYDTHARQFRPFLPNNAAECADFSKDGQRIAYVTNSREITGPQSLWVSRTDGSHKVQITQPPLAADLPRWSPDGKWIAFMGKEPGQPWRVRVVSVDGGAYLPVTTVNDEEGAPTWSPDGSKLAFGGLVHPPQRSTGRLVIHLYSLETHQVSSVPGSEGLWTARWSPDGRYIAALTEDARNLMLFDFHTTRWEKLATLARITDLVWSRHEEALYFNGEPTTGERAVYRVKIPSGQVELLASLRGGTYTDWLGLTPEDSPLIARGVGRQDVYALTVNWP